MAMPPSQIEPLRKPPTLVSKGETFTFRFTKHPPEHHFHGLWELVMLDKTSKIIKMISDADALNFCIENLMGELENSGY